MPSPEHPLLKGAGPHLRWRWGWLKGVGYRLKWMLCGQRVRAGKRFSVQGRLRVRGPGWVEFGSDCLVDGNTDLFTHAPEAKISIGDRCFLNGSRVSSVQSILIDSRCIIADARLMDTDFHSVARDRLDREAKIAVASIHIEENVWVAAGAAVLKGVQIGRNSVVGFGAVVVQSVPSDAIVAGNPARVVAQVPSNSSKA